LGLITLFVAFLGVGSILLSPALSLSRVLARRKKKKEGGGWGGERKWLLKKLLSREGAFTLSKS